MNKSKLNYSYFGFKSHFLCVLNHFHFHLKKLKYINYFCLVFLFWTIYFQWSLCFIVPFPGRIWNYISVFYSSIFLIEFGTIYLCFIVSFLNFFFKRVLNLRFLFLILFLVLIILVDKRCTRIYWQRFYCILS